MAEERYEIQRKIGEGGAGSVYLARDTRLGREVAIKRLIEEEGGGWTQETVDTMLQEARLLSSLDHPNIVTIYDADVDEDGPYVVMELLQGRNMDELIAENAMTLSDFKLFATHCLEALSAAHSLNVIHRDIKPNNIVLKWFPNGKFQAKLLDFGMAKLSKVPTKQTVDHSDSVLGSIYFMAPEQFERSELDPRTDIYALGAVFYYALTSHYPFTGETPAVVMASHLTHRVQPIGELRSDLPEWLCNWIMWLINREMEHRPESAQVALDYFLANEREQPLLSEEHYTLHPREGDLQVGQASDNTAANAHDNMASVARPTLLTESGKLANMQQAKVTISQENLTKKQSVKASDMSSSRPAPVRTSALQLNTDSSKKLAPAKTVPLTAGSNGKPAPRSTQVLVSGASQPSEKAATTAPKLAVNSGTSSSASPLATTGAKVATSKAGSAANASPKGSSSQPADSATQPSKPAQPAKPKAKPNLIPVFIIAGIVLIGGALVMMSKLENNKVVGRYNDLITQTGSQDAEVVRTSKADLDFLTSMLLGVLSLIHI